MRPTSSHSSWWLKDYWRVWLWLMFRGNVYQVVYCYQTLVWFASKYVPVLQESSDKARLCLIAWNIQIRPVLDRASPEIWLEHCLDTIQTRASAAQALLDIMVAGDWMRLSWVSVPIELSPMVKLVIGRSFELPSCQSTLITFKRYCNCRQAVPLDHKTYGWSVHSKQRKRIGQTAAK